MSTLEFRHRTVVSIDRIEGDTMVCTVGGIDLPESSVRLPLAALVDDTMRAEAAPERVFFAYANLDAARPEDVRVDRIERKWGVTDGPLFFEANDA